MMRGVQTFSENVTYTADIYYYITTEFDPRNVTFALVAYGRNLK